MKATDTETQLKILARIARGDTLKSISEEMGMALPTVSAIKQRNKQALSVITDKMADHQVSNAKKILDKSHKLIENKLDKALTADDERNILIEQFKAKEISYEEFQAQMDALTRVSLSELNSVAKEAFNQSQIERGGPTSISSSPAQAQQDLTDLVQAINKPGNEVELYKMVLKGKS